MTRDASKLVIAVGVAALLWFYMFSPWTAGRPNFWIVMSVAAIVLTTLTITFTLDRTSLAKVEKPLLQLVGGVAIAFALWGVFWVGDKLSSMMFSFARPEVDAVYAMKTGLPPSVITILLLALIGPAEELFWRGYVQRTLARLLPCRRAADVAFVMTAVVYALIHVWSLNFMLVMAALVAGCVWGFIFRLCPKALPALIISHALWDALVFVILPI
ncbi:MAG: CPBP family intramembrane metalloprotease [Bacteroidaceae bacterium]|nr:CPBP family intramembrane metalloprotease [Bacteroidaceae bacterium]